MTAKIVSAAAIVISALLIVLGLARLDGHGSRETVSSMSVVLAGALVAFAIADTRK